MENCIPMPAHVLFSEMPRGFLCSATHSLNTLEKIWGGLYKLLDIAVNSLTRLFSNHNGCYIYLKRFTWSRHWITNDYVEAQLPYTTCWEDLIIWLVWVEQWVVWYFWNMRLPVMTGSWHSIQHSIRLAQLIMELLWKTKPAWGFMGCNFTALQMVLKLLPKTLLEGQHGNPKLREFRTLQLSWCTKTQCPDWRCHKLPRGKQIARYSTHRRWSYSNADCSASP